MSERSLSQLAYVEGQKSFTVLARMKPRTLKDRLHDPFKDEAVIQDLEREIRRRVKEATDEPRAKLEDLLHLVHTYNESHTPFERLKYIAGNPDWLRRSTNLN